jgi:hypothetical protein
VDNSESCPQETAVNPGFPGIKNGNAPTMRVTSDKFNNKLSTAMLINVEKISLKAFFYPFLSHF